MAKFLTGKELEEEVCNIIWDASETLLIVSPYIKLDDYFKKLFDNHINNPKVHLVIMFGKNEKNISKSLSKSDFDFFKRFPNVSIIYVPNLHAKYYANERKGIITSINLYDYSFKNNIEYAFFSETNLLGIGNSTDNRAWEMSWEVAERNEAVFIKRPVYEKKLLSAIIGNNYIKSDILHDTTQKFYSSFGNIKTPIKYITDFEAEIFLGSKSTDRPRREDFEEVIHGYCIRTGVKIPFNKEKPYCESAFKSWSQWKNPNYPEKFCHRTGKQSFGKTSMQNPFL